MDQRRPRLGDILDDYCPRERRITNHAVVALVEDDVKQTRCTTCDAEHEYKHAKVPAARRKKTAAPTAHLVEAASAPPADSDTVDTDTHDDAPAEDMPVMADAVESEPADDVEIAAAPMPSEDVVADPEPADEESSESDNWPVHRPLIRATLPRPEGQTPERKAPDFTFRPGGGKFDQNRNGQRPRGHRPARQGQGQPGQGGSRFGGPRPSGQGQRGPGFGGGPQGQRHGNRSGQGQGPGRGPRPGGGRKRGR